MAKKSLIVRIAVGVGMTLAAVGVVAAGTAIGNNGLKNQLDKWKDDITNKINPPEDKKDDSSTDQKTSTQAAVVEKVYFQESLPLILLQSAWSL